MTSIAMDTFLQVAISRGLGLMLDQAWFKAAAVVVERFFPTKSAQWQWMLLYALFLTLVIFFVQFLLRKFMVLPNLAKRELKTNERLSQRLMILLTEDNLDNTPETTLDPERLRRRVEMARLRTELDV